MRLLYGFPMRSGKRAHASDMLEEFEDAVLERDLDVHGGPENCTVARALSGHHANALFVRGAQALSMPEGRAERAVEAQRRALVCSATASITSG
jgi:hypothetical protein